MDSLTPEYWERRYLEGQTGWDVGHVSEPLRRIIDSLTDKSLRILVPGAGNGYEAAYLWEQGFRQVYLLDWAAAPLRRFAERYPDFPKEQLLQADFFTLSESYDLILEQTFFCALDPEKRPAYVRQMHQLLRPGGRLRGVLFDRDFERPGPPFGGSRAEYESLFEPFFHIRTLHACTHSESTRRELLIDLEPKKTPGHR